MTELAQDTTAEISVDQLADILAAEDVRIIDVREPDEYLAGHVEGSWLIPMGQLASRLGEVPRDRRVLVICRTGNRSGAMTELLRAQGFDAANVAGGVVDWERSGRPLVTGRAPLARPKVIALDTPTLGNRSYLVHDGVSAFVVDPQRDLDRVYEVLAAEGVRLTDIFETHVHNDYLTGGVVLGRETGAVVHVNADDPVQYERNPIKDDDVIEVGSMRVRAIATPGHTFTHLSYALTAAGEEIGVFTGGSLLYGATGRPDLLGPDHTEALVRHQYASAHRLAEELPEQALVFPTHGFGSFCAATQSEATESTIGQERLANPVLTHTEAEYVEELLAGLDAFPAYYAQMGPGNTVGPDAADLSLPRRAAVEDIRRAIENGEWVVDLRNRTAFAGGHVVGSLNFGIDGQFATYLGWLIPWGTPVTLLGETEEQVLEARRELVRIGIDEPAGAATGNPLEWTDSPLGRFGTAKFADMREVSAHRPITMLDVRRNLERAEGWIPGSVHIPIHELLGRLDEVSGEVWVHCAAGFRASIAASILAAAGRHVVAVDDDFEHAVEAGFDLERRMSPQ